MVRKEDAPMDQSEAAEQASLTELARMREADTGNRVHGTFTFTENVPVRGHMRGWLFPIADDDSRHLVWLQQDNKPDGLLIIGANEIPGLEDPEGSPQHPVRDYLRLIQYERGNGETEGHFVGPIEVHVPIEQGSIRHAGIEGLPYYFHHKGVLIADRRDETKVGNFPGALAKA